jgi:hypothetical protein
MTFFWKGDTTRSPPRLFFSKRGGEGLGFLFNLHPGRSPGVASWVRESPSIKFLFLLRLLSSLAFFFGGYRDSLISFHIQMRKKHEWRKQTLQMGMTFHPIQRDIFASHIEGLSKWNGKYRSRAPTRTSWLSGYPLLVVEDFVRGKLPQQEDNFHPSRETWTMQKI